MLRFQHTHHIDRLTEVWLRRNSLGAFNVLSVELSSPPAMCRSETPAAEPYIRPPNGVAFSDFVKATEADYDRR